nr:hypothetical protein [Halomonas qijiaojingensis]
MVVAQRAGGEIELAQVIALLVHRRQSTAGQMGVALDIDVRRAAGGQAADHGVAVDVAAAMLARPAADARDRVEVAGVVPGTAAVSIGIRQRVGFTAFGLAQTDPCTDAIPGAAATAAVLARGDDKVTADPGLQVLLRPDRATDEVGVAHRVDGQPVGMHFAVGVVHRPVTGPVALVGEVQGGAAGGAEQCHRGGQFAAFGVGALGGAVPAGQDVDVVEPTERVSCASVVDWLA